MWIIILRVKRCIFPCKFIFKTKACDAPRNEKLHIPIVRVYAARLIGLNEHLASFPGATLSDKISVTGLDEILLDSMHNSWYKQAYVQVFDFESILFKKAANMFDFMYIAESIYKGVVEPSYKKSTLADANRYSRSRNNRVEVASSKTLPVTQESTGKRRKQYVDFLMIKSKPVSFTALDILLMNVRS